MGREYLADAAAENGDRMGAADFHETGRFSGPGPDGGDQLLG
jgi:hypothetical protein